MLKYPYSDEKRLYRALAHPVRRDIIKKLQPQGAIVAHLARFYPAISLSALSQHLKVLEQAGLVHHDNTHRAHYYRLDRLQLRRFYSSVKQLVQRKRR